MNEELPSLIPYRLSRYSPEYVARLYRDWADREPINTVPDLRFAELLQSGDLSEETVRKFVRAFDQGGA